MMFDVVKLGAETVGRNAERFRQFILEIANLGGITQTVG
jgi:hypothetical protein